MSYETATESGADAKARENYMILSADSHAGADLHDYKPYLVSSLHDEFDAWATAFNDPWAEIDSNGSELKMGVSSAVQSANWDSAKRQRDLESDGVVGEVLFPNTAPPFFPSGALTAAQPRTRAEYERRRAGLQAHNRWLADFCAQLPGRRAGVAQILLNDVDDAVAEIKWAKGAGLTGGILIPVMQPGSELPMMHDPVYTPLWRVCEELAVPINCHTAATGYPTDGSVTSRTLAWLEIPFYSQRMLWHLIFGGVFEKHPRLKFVLTEQGAGWVAKGLSSYDRLVKQGRHEGRPERMFIGETVDALSLTPSEYFARNCYVAATFMVPREVHVRHSLGVDHVMWGSDYPHSEGTFPFTTEALRASFAEVPESELRPMLGETAARLYGLDLAVLNAAAARFGPSVREVAVPLEEYPAFPTETACPVFDKVS